VTPEQRTLLEYWLEVGFGQLQLRVNRGDEDVRLPQLVEMFEAYFELSKTRLGHDRVPIATWETYMMIKRRYASQVTT
jgi:hypothetical protein